MNIGEQTTPRRCGSSDGVLPEWRWGATQVAQVRCGSGTGALLQQRCIVAAVAMHR